MNRCVRTGCTGSYGPEGYCDECGRRAPAAPVAPPTSAPPVAVAGTPTATAGAVPTVVAARDSRNGPTAPMTISGSGSGSGTRSGRSRSSRGGLGAGLIDLPRMPLRDPASAVLRDPKVAEARRFCARCDKPVGRSRDGQPGRDEGFCPNCGTRFSFLPGLAPGDLISGRYEILGVLAYGGLGWIYLARDRNVSDTVADRWVVLKGLINTGDADATAAAVAERRFLVELDHPNIVKIHDFVQHPDPRSGEPVGYIVMEYVGGRSLRDVLLTRRNETGQPALPLPEAIAYAVEILPALGYLHDRDLLFCDFKPDNVIHAEEQLKLIDLGAVRHVDDRTSAIYGTPGYQAPEVATRGPSVASDLYTVGRALAVLSFEFRGFSTTYADRLPTPAEVPLLAAEESYHRLLRRTTHPEPERRFQSAAEMSEQLLGVLREVLSAADGVPRPTVSRRFTGERRVFGADAGEVGEAVLSALVSDTPGGMPPPPPLPAPTAVAAALPLPQVDVLDPGAGFLASLASGAPEETIRQLSAAPIRSREIDLRLAWACIEQGDLTGAHQQLQLLAATDPFDWRVDWYRGLAALAAGQPGAARAAFDAVYDALPGEPAARLALAVTVELTGDRDAASALYDRVWRVDRGWLSAAFGLARIRLAAGDRGGALAVLDQVPESSSQHITAQVAAIRAALHGAPTTTDDLLRASARLERLGLDVERQARLTVEMLRTALAWVTTGPPAVGGARFLGHELTERGLRSGLEQAYRTLAQLARDRDVRIALVDQANSVRPRTWV